MSSRPHRFLGAAFAAILTAGCVVPSDERLDPRLLGLQSPSRDKRDEAFQALLRGGNDLIPDVRAAMDIGPGFGFPAVALLYAAGRGDAVPTDLRARHLASFEWPRLHAVENAVVEPYVWTQIEQDLIREGRPALRWLGRALEESAVSEPTALRVVGAMLAIGGRAAAEEFAAHLDSFRGLDSIRICDAAAAGLLLLGRQEPALRLADPDARREAARQWWDVAKDFSESEWIRETVEALVKKWQPKDPEGVRGVVELLTGRTLDDPRAWWEENRDWRPAPAPLQPKDLLSALAADRARAYDANRRLEESTGVRVAVPRATRLSDLCASLRLWQPPPDLGLRWRRYLEAPLLRLSIAAIGYSPRHESHHVRWAYETCFAATGEDSGELRIETQTETYALFAQAFEFGTRIVVSEAHGAPEGWTGVLREFRAGRPAVMFSPSFKSAIVAVVEEVEARRIPPPVEKIQAEWRARLRSWADSPEALHALGYFQEGEDRGLLKERRAGEALLLLGDPAALELKPRLKGYEIDMALRKAQDPRVREYLRALTSSE